MLVVGGVGLGATGGVVILVVDGVVLEPLKEANKLVRVDFNEVRRPDKLFNIFI